MEMRQRNYLKKRHFDAQTANTFQPTHAGEAQADDSHLRAGGGQQFQGVLRAGSGAHTPKAERPGKNGLQSLAQWPVSLDEADAKFR